MNAQQNANAEKAYEIANSYDGDTCDSLDITTACLGMANWKDALIEEFKHHADNMYTEMMNLSTDASRIRKAMEDYKHFLFTEYYTDGE